MPTSAAEHARCCARKLAVLALLFAAACGGEDTKPPPAVASLDGGDDGGTGDDGADGFVTLDGVTADAGDDNAHCIAEDDGAAADSSDDGGDEDDDGFKFDVGAPEGGTDFPVDCDEVTETLTNLGCEFWAVDLPNDYRGTPMSPPASEQQFAVVVANSSSLCNATVSIFVGDEMIEVATAAVPPGEIHEFALDPLDIDPVVGTDDGLAYRIESDVPITAYQFNPLDNQVQVYSNDASLLLPTHALGMEYTAVTGDAILLGMSIDDPDPVNAGAFVSVVASEDDTDVELTPTSSLVEGPTGATLMRGEVLTVLSTAAGANFGNLSGTRVSASKPVAVFGGNVATAIPSGSPNCCADHIEHQMPPHEAWGSAYAVAPPPSPIADTGDRAVYRLTAAFPDTALRYCPTQPSGAPDMLQPGDTAEFETDQPFTVESDPDKPFALTQFLESFEALSPNQPGDPAMLVIPSLGQAQRRFVFAVPAGYAQNYVTIVTRGLAEVTLDGETITTDALQPVGVARSREHFFVWRPVGAGAHIVESEAPIGITVMGFDSAVSYGYAGGSGLRVIAVPPVQG